ncbi:DUF1516 family protein [Paenibacillus piri]|uniref:DUF1516 family protein n=1 Tax=Paenibacillus piri TaxID=2547395 RepID=A0A4R5KB18_9BACL|nr:DUF1516 family protein [Paenibacillus piri]TDF92339.1 DUF1516 family protein [Paenibacillus piri]
MFNILYQSHAGTWALMLIAFILSVIFQRQKVTSIILKVLYLIMLVSGIGMLFMLGFPLLFVLKGVLAIILIGMMEVILARRRRNQPELIMWLIWLVALVLILLLGFGVI